MQVGVGMSTAPDPRTAASAAARAAADRLGSTEPTLAVLVSSLHFARDAEQVLETVHHVAAPGSLVGCVAAAVVAGGREVEGEPAVAVWLAALSRITVASSLDEVMRQVEVAVAQAERSRLRTVSGMRTGGRGTTGATR